MYLYSNVVCQPTLAPTSDSPLAPNSEETETHFIEGLLGLPASTTPSMYMTTPYSDLALMGSYLQAQPVNSGTDSFCGRNYDPSTFSRLFKFNSRNAAALRAFDADDDDEEFEEDTGRISSRRGRRRSAFLDDISNENDNIKQVLGFSPQPLTLEQIKYSGILESIPKKPSTQAGAPVINIGDISDSCEICKALIDIGYDIRLGEAGRATLKREISRRLKESVHLRDLCVTQVCRLKNANVLQLIQMSELTGCLLLALRISSAYWKDYNRKQTTGNSQSTVAVKSDFKSKMRGIRKSSSPLPTLEPPADVSKEAYFPELEFSSSPDASGVSVSPGQSPLWRNSITATEAVAPPPPDNQDHRPNFPRLEEPSPDLYTSRERDEDSSSRELRQSRRRRRRRRRSPAITAGGRQRRRGRPRKTARERQDAPWRPRRSSRGDGDAVGDGSLASRAGVGRRRLSLTLDEAEFDRQLRETIQNSLQDVAGHVESGQRQHKSPIEAETGETQARGGEDEEMELCIPETALAAEPLSHSILGEPPSFQDLELVSTTDSLVEINRDERARKRRLEATETSSSLVSSVYDSVQDRPAFSDVSLRVVQRRVDLKCWRMTVSCINTFPA